MKKDSKDQQFIVKLNKLLNQAIKRLKVAK